MIPYGAIPIEAHLAMISAEQANVPVLADAARMWTEVRAWIEQARLELHTRAYELLPQWPDEAGREFEGKVERTLAELQMWGQRIDASQVIETLTTLSTAIPPVFQAVTGLYQGYMAALSNPFTAPAAPGFQQAAGAAMTALGAHFDGAMLKVCTAAGIQSPADVIPDFNAEDAATALDTAKDALSSLSSLTSAMGTGADMLTGGGPSLAGLTPVAPTTGAELSGVNNLTGLGGAGGGGGIGAVGSRWPVATGLTAARPTPAVGARPTVAGGTPLARSAGTAASRAGTGSPMMPPMAGGAGAAGRPKQANDDRSRNRARKAKPQPTPHGVPANLRGRSGKSDPTLNRRQSQDEDPSSIDLLDEQWRLDAATSTAWSTMDEQAHRAR
ncbi:hypothetical protein [Actinokineospora sp. HUAS TT18]|uniref:hypothetical protein n=1 Tax=Actinokineospora sp. HUAS TT18 TaxID=3447451 RepID=UPI003F51C896